MSNVYGGLPLLKARLDIESGADDAILLSVLESTSQAIDNIISERRGCSTRFYTTENDEARYFSAMWEDRVVIDDLISLTSLKCDTNGDGTYDTTLSSGEYALMPYQAALDSAPYTHIVTTMTGGVSFSLVPNGVEVTGKFGYIAAEPSNIQEAAMLAAMRLYRRKDAVFGSASPLDFNIVQGEIVKDVDVMMLLDGIPVREKRLRLAR